VYINGQGEFFSLRDISLSDDMFVREEVSAEETFKVEGIPLRPYFLGGAKLRTTKAKVGLYQISSTMEEWSEDLISRLINERDGKGRPLDPHEVAPIFLENPEWVNDDTGLIGLCHEKTANQKGQQTVSLISNDKRLANKMAETCNVKVIRISPQEFVRLASVRGIEINAQMETKFLKEFGIETEHVFKDTGSISAVSVDLTTEDGTNYTRKVHHTGWYGDIRYSQITLSELKKSHLRRQLHKPVTRPRLWRGGSRPYESVYSSHSSWKGSQTHRSGSSISWLQDKQDMLTRSPA
jgi:hypothetical protein